MDTSKINELKNRAIGIQNEKNEGKNTADRVGHLMYDMIDYDANQSMVITELEEDNVVMKGQIADIQAGGGGQITARQRTYFVNVTHDTMPPLPSIHDYDNASNTFQKDGYTWKFNNDNPGDNEDTWQLWAWFNEDETLPMSVGGPILVYDSSKVGPQGGNGADSEDIEWIYYVSTTTIDWTSQAYLPVVAALESYAGTSKIAGSQQFGGLIFYDHPQGIDSINRYEYASYRYSSVDENGKRIWGVTGFSVPFLWSSYGEKGIDGDGIEYIFYASTDGIIHGETENRPQDWDENTTGKWKDPNDHSKGRYVFTEPEFIAEGSDWTDEPIDMSKTEGFGQGAVQWVSKRSKRDGEWQKFSSPAVWSRLAKDGIVDGYTVELVNENMPVGTDNEGKAAAPWGNTATVQVDYNGDPVQYGTGEGQFTYTIGAITCSDPSLEGDLREHIHPTQNGANIDVSLDAVGVTGFDGKNAYIPITVTLPNNTTRALVLTLYGVPVGEAGKFLDLYVGTKTIRTNWEEDIVMPEKFNIGVIYGEETFLSAELVNNQPASGSAEEKGFWFFYYWDQEPSNEQPCYGVFSLMTGKNYVTIVMKKKVGNNYVFVDSETISYIHDGATGNTPVNVYIWHTSATEPPQTYSGGYPPTDGSATTWQATVKSRPGNTYYLWGSNNIKYGDGSINENGWSAPFIMTGKEGDPGADAKDIEWIYARNSVNQSPAGWTGINGGTAPNPNTGVRENVSGEDRKKYDDFVPLNWSDSPQGVEPIDKTYEFASWRKKAKGATEWGDFQDPVLWSHYGHSGIDGDGLEYVFIRTRDADAPTISTSTGTNGGNSSYRDGQGNTIDYTMDDFLPLAKVGSDYFRCTDDPLGPDGVNYNYEWVATRKKLPAQDGVRAWEKYGVRNSGKMALWTKWSKDGDTWTIDSDGYWCLNGTRYGGSDPSKWIKAEGRDGTGIQLKGSVTNYSDLPTSGLTVGDCYVVTSNQHLYMWTGTEWNDVGKFQGDPGANSYIHIAYATSVTAGDCEGFTTVKVEGVVYPWMGIYVDHQPIDPEASQWQLYEWNEIRGQSSFKSSVFVRMNNTPTAPTNGSYANPSPQDRAGVNSSGQTVYWKDGIPAGTDIIWMSTRIFTNDGTAPQESSWSTPRQMSDTADIDIEFSPSNTQPNAPTGDPFTNRESAGWYDPSSSNFSRYTMIWRAERRVKNGQWATGSSWTISRIYGEQGPIGPTGPSGTNGENSVHVTIDNEHEDFLYDAAGNLLSPSGGAYSQANLYDGHDLITSGMTWGIDFTNSSGVPSPGQIGAPSISNSSSDRGRLTVPKITSDSARVRVYASYEGTNYYAVFTANKTSNDKYELNLSPNSVSYNSSTSYTVVTVTASISGIAGNGQQLTGLSFSSSPGAGNFCLYWGHVKANGTIDGGMRNLNSSGTSVTKTIDGEECQLYVGVYFELRRYNSSSTNDYRLCDYETVEIAKVANGATGPQGPTGPEGPQGPAGLKGDNGLQGCVVRTSEWKAAGVYRNDTGKNVTIGYIDVVAIANSSATEGYDFYVLKPLSADTYQSSTSPKYDTLHWEKLTNVGPIYTSLLVAKDAFIKFGAGNQFVITDTNGYIKAGMKGTTDSGVSDGIRIWAGSSISGSSATDSGLSDAKFRVYNSGKAVMTDADVQGKITATSGNIIGDVNLGSTSGYHVVLKSADGSLHGYSGNSQTFELDTWYKSQAVLRLFNLVTGSIGSLSADQMNVSSSSGNYNININAITTYGGDGAARFAVSYIYTGQSVSSYFDVTASWNDLKLILKGLPTSQPTEVGRVWVDSDGYLRIKK